MAETRQDAWKLASGWSETFLWYAKAVIELKQRPLDDLTSWRFLAAMHQFNRQRWINLGVIGAGTALPPAAVVSAAWSQCQHSSYYFLPWHRGYLARFEQIVGATIKTLGGPADWKLPYWNYLDATNPNARKIPEAFLLEFLPDGTTPNPLQDVPRFGQKEIGPEPLLEIDDIDLSAMGETQFSGSVSFGGSVTPFSNPSVGDPGALEIAPHGSVHVLVGGALPAHAGDGFLSAFSTAGLDPLFWLHHCNIDRLWEAWMTKPGVNVDTSRAWLDGPTDRAFVVPHVDGSGLEKFTPRDTLSGGKFHPTYADLHLGTGVAPAGPGVVVVDQGAQRMPEPEVIGANGERLVIGTTPADTAVRVAPAQQAAVVTAMGPGGPASDDGDRLFLKLENIKGASIAGGIKAYLNLPLGMERRADLPQDRVAGSAALFGLASASEEDGAHGGNGLTFTFDISELARRLIEIDDFDPENLRVKIVAAHGGGDEKPLTIERVSVLRG